jgi:diketogulonate reductase-like aldo/keto reductase
VDRKLSICLPLLTFASPKDLIGIEKTSKVWNAHHRPDLVLGALEDTLKELDMDYLDLYLM